jgi:endonuclease/exonuclease/phosphatase (EEP) superfamily protein YafD
MAREWVDAGDGPTVVGGDFNLPVESSIFQRHWGDLINSFSAAGTGWGVTKRTTAIGVRIDHVLVGREWRVVSSFVGPEIGSDHLPLVTDLVLAPRR